MSSDDRPSSFVEVSILCDRCEELLTANADTYPAAQNKLMALARDLAWYVADRAGTNGSSLVKRPTCDLCPKCYEAWLSAGAAGTG